MRFANLIKFTGLARVVSLHDLAVIFCARFHQEADRQRRGAVRSQGMSRIFCCKLRILSLSL